MGKSFPSETKELGAGKNLGSVPRILHPFKKQELIFISSMTSTEKLSCDPLPLQTSLISLSVCLLGCFFNVDTVMIRIFTGHKRVESLPN